MHDSTGWPIVAITDSHNVFEDGYAGGGSAMHWTVRGPHGRLIHIDGAHRTEDLVREYDGKAAAGISTRADAVEWYVEAQGEPVPIELAKTFVASVLKRAGAPRSET